jgi:hypothetical protein
MTLCEDRKVHFCTFSPWLTTALILTRYKRRWKDTKVIISGEQENVNAMGIEDQNYTAIGMRDRVFLQLRFFRVQSASDRKEE